MRRFELRGARSKCWEIAVAGDSYTVRISKLPAPTKGRAGKAVTEVHACISPARATAEAQREMLRRLKQGYVEIEHGEREPGFDRLTEYLGPEYSLASVVEFERSRGVIVKAHFRSRAADPLAPSPGAIMRALVGSPVAAGLRELAIEGAFDELLAAWTSAGSLAALTTLTLGDVEEVWDPTDHALGDLTPALAAAPELRTLRVVNGSIELSSLVHERLESLSFETGYMQGATAAVIARASLPAATRLVIAFGCSESDDSQAVIEELEPLFNGRGVPKLRDLGLIGAEFTDEIARALADSPLLAKLRSLDLSGGNLRDEGAEAIVAAAERFASLERLDLRFNALSTPAQRRLQEALAGVEVVLDGQRPG